MLILILASHYIHLKIVQRQQTNIWLHFVSSLFSFKLDLMVRIWALLSLISWSCFSGIWQGDAPQLAGGALVNHNQEARSRQGQRGRNNSSAIVQSLFGLAELSKSRIWPQHNTEPTNLSRGVRKSPQHSRFTGSRQSLRISSHPVTACATQCFFHRSWCFIYSYILLFFHSRVAFLTSGCLLCLSTLMEVTEVWWRAKQTKPGYCASICYPINTNTHQTSLKPVHVQFSSVTESNQLCHPCHKSPSAAAAPSPDGNRPCSLALASVS